MDLIKKKRNILVGVFIFLLIFLFSSFFLLVDLESKITKIKEEKNVIIKTTDRNYYSPIYLEYEMEEAYDFVDKLKNIFYQKDIDELSSMMNYPLLIVENDDSEYYVENKDSFILLFEKKFFNENYIKEIITTNFSSNYMWHIIGQKPSFYFKYNDDNVYKIHVIKM